MENTIPETLVTSKIYIVRSKKIIQDRDLADRYEVETILLNQAVQRNIERFPMDFMFQLTMEEFEILKSQIVTSSWGGTRKMPFAFTELCKALHTNIFLMNQLRNMMEFLRGNLGGTWGVHMGLKCSTSYPIPNYR